MAAENNPPKSMNDRQNTAMATAVVGLVLVVVFLCPWRVESTGEIEWSPIYQQPMSYVRSYNDLKYGERGGSRIESEDAQIAIDILALEVLLVGATGGALYLYNSDSDRDNEGPPPPSVN